mmetsp:Transcript_32956/g.57852  ORF Transcript_32956/g.57852 Transcript_32956/m.57852 type:complete len:170 (+) Transcript_32956:3537-4046(+)
MESAAARFECHICYELASAPVVTRCGHLFCWTCLHHWMQQNRATVTCPVCKGGISESSLIPLYTRGEGEDQLDDSNLPNRPNAEWQQPVPNQSYNPFEGFSRPLQSTQAESVTISAGYGFFPSLVTLIGTVDFDDHPNEIQTTDTVDPKTLRLTSLGVLGAILGCLCLC